MSYHPSASAPAIYTPVIGPTHISTSSYADSTCSSNSDVSPFFYEGIWLEGPDAPPQDDASTEQTPLLSAQVPFDPELDGFQVNTNITPAVPLESGDLESGSLVQVEEVVGVEACLSSIIGILWRWILRIFQGYGLVSNTDSENEEEEEED